MTKQRKRSSRKTKPYYVMLRQIESDLIAQLEMGGSLDLKDVDIDLCWTIGREINTYVTALKKKSPFAPKLARDIKRQTGGASRFKAADIRALERFYAEWTDWLQVEEPKGPPGVLQTISWNHNRILLEKLDAPEDRLWYARKAAEQPWSQTELLSAIKQKQIDIQGLELDNFDAALDEPELVRSVFQSRYRFDTLSIPRKGASEAYPENELIAQMKSSLGELGKGFAFVGNQVPLPVKGKTRPYRIDLLFYHLRLRRYVVVELKRYGREFDPRFVSQIARYVELVDDHPQLHHEDDNATVGIILCKTTNPERVQRSLESARVPIGVADFTIPEEVTKLARFKKLFEPLK